MATVSEIHLPNVDLPKIEVPAFDVSNIDLGAGVSGAAEAVGLRRAPRRSRRLFVIGGLMVAAAAGWGLLRSPQVRARSQRLLGDIRERISSMRPSSFDLDVDDPADPIAFPSAETKPIPPDRWNDTEDLTTPDYPEGLGSDSGDAGAAHRESESRV